MSVCPACGGLLRPWRRGIRVCRACGSSSREVVPEAHERDSHYSSYYDRVPELSPLTSRRLEEWAQALLPFRKTGRILEVGCGAGHFLSAAQAVGFEAWGTEISSSGLERLRRAGFQAYAGDLPGLRLPEGHFDAVALFEVLEHLASPEAYLGESRRVLRKGGLLVLTTPNFDSLSRRLLADRWRIVDPEHLVLFTSRGLHRALERAGFRPLALWSRNIDPMELARALRHQSQRETEDRQSRTDAYREALASRPWLAVLKGAANAALRLLAMGDTLEARALR